MRPFDEQQSFNRSPLDDETLLSGQFWGELRVFLAVAKTKSFNRAAEILNTSQPTVSRQVKRLQDIVGSQLFISTPRGVKLTQIGIGGRLATPPLPHHRTYGSVSGGSVDYANCGVATEAKPSERKKRVGRAMASAGLLLSRHGPCGLPAVWAARSRPTPRRRSSA